MLLLDLFYDIDDDNLGDISYQIFKNLLHKLLQEGQ
jgi:hypothetical protein